MNKTQLIDALAARYEGNRKAAAHALDAVLDTITREVAKGEKVAITGFGSFEKRIRPARWVRNPQTGEKLKAKKTAVPKFNPGADLKNVISGAKKLPALTLASLPAVPGMTRKPAASAKPAATKAAPATKTAAAPASKPAAKKAPAAKATAKAPAKKAPAKRAPAKTATAKKTTAKTATAKTATAKTATAKTATAKTATAKKTTAKKAPAKKTTAKKAAGTEGS
ncbi:HU family DNA-binding protein [Nocardioides sp.]|uniref:HU family DNA-binding protein n=1 Tax=Nocardioides sp. TaxID=35761 RepID=UPI003D124FB1